MEFLTNIDWAIIFKIVMIDVMLGVDNAIVIALACAGLQESVKNKAMLAGTAGAVGLRAILLVFATALLGIPYLKIVAGAYLVYVGYKLLIENTGEHNVEQKSTVWGAMWTIVVADFFMSLDNVMAVAGTASSHEHSAIYAIAGIVLSIPIIIYGAKYLMKWMEQYPIIIWIGAGMLGWVGAEMIVSDSFFGTLSNTVHVVAKVMGAAIVVGLSYLKISVDKKAVTA